MFTGENTKTKRGGGGGIMNKQHNEQTDWHQQIIFCIVPKADAHKPIKINI